MTERHDAASLERHVVQSVLEHLHPRRPTYRITFKEVTAEVDPQFPSGHQPRLCVNRDQVLLVEGGDRPAVRTPCGFAAQGRIAWSFEWNHSMKAKKECCREALEEMLQNRCIEDRNAIFVDIEDIVHLGH